MGTTHKLLRFGVFELNLDTEELRKAGTILKMAPQPFQLLAMLANHAGQVVTREEIKEQLWGADTYVDFEQGMNRCIKQIRTVLADNADNPLYIETLPRRGYRFLAPVVSKNVLAPAPNVIKSSSGVQSGIGLVLPNEPIPKVPEAAPASSAKVISREEQVSDSGAVSARSTEPFARKDKVIPPDRITSSTAAAETLAPEIARLRKSSAQTRRSLAWISVILVLLGAAVLYWYLHRP